MYVYRQNCTFCDTTPYACMYLHLYLSICVIFFIHVRRHCPNKANISSSSTFGQISHKQLIQYGKMR